MKRREFLVSAVAATALAGRASANAVEDQILALLQQEGYTVVSESRTWLWRIRIVAKSDRNWRELIFNPRTGEILRDYWEPVDSDTGYFRAYQNASGNSGSGSSNSGSGSRNSGSGSSNSGKGKKNDDDDHDDDD